MRIHREGEGGDGDDDDDDDDDDDEDTVKTGVHCISIDLQATSGVSWVRIVFCRRSLLVFRPVC